MKLPFEGSRVVESLPLEEVLSLIDERTLFRARWGYRRGELSSEAYERTLDEHARPALADLRRTALAGRLLEPGVVYGWYRCHSDAGDVVVLSPGGAEAFRVRFASVAGMTASDLATPLAVGGPGGDAIGLLVVTAGNRPLELAKAHHDSGAFLDSLRVHGFAVEAAEALAEWTHRRMLREAGVGEDELAPATRRGARVSPGFPCCRDLATQRDIFALLQPSRVGLFLTESFQMVPEASVSAFVLHRAGARRLVA